MRVWHAGEVLAQFGAGEFYMPHMTTVDNSGNVWTTDVGTHVATKWSPAGKKLLELGTSLEPGSDRTHFCKPTQVCRLTHTLATLPAPVMTSNKEHIVPLLLSEVLFQILRRPVGQVERASCWLPTCVLI